MAWNEISTSQAHELISSGKDVVVLDVRTPMEYLGPCGHIDGSILIPIDELPFRWRELEPFKETPVVAICYSGVRGRAACNLLARAGFTTLYNAPGMMEWHDLSLPVVPGQATPEMPDC